MLRTRRCAHLQHPLRHADGVLGGAAGDVFHLETLLQLLSGEGPRATQGHVGGEVLAGLRRCQLPASRVLHNTKAACAAAFPKPQA